MRHLYWNAPRRKSSNLHADEMSEEDIDDYFDPPLLSDEDAEVGLNRYISFIVNTQ